MLDMFVERGKYVLSTLCHSRSRKTEKCITEKSLSTTKHLIYPPLPFSIACFDECWVRSYILAGKNRSFLIFRVIAKVTSARYGY